MSDPLRTHDAAPDADRDAKIEQLLLAGLDHYFSGQYENAINVWTRALFLDRTHARARAYIERARSALAEGQRETDELLHSGLAAFERGENREARRLLQSAIGRGAPSDEALAVLDRLDRLEAGSNITADTDAPPVRRSRADSPSARHAEPSGFRYSAAVAAFAVAVVVVGAGFAVEKAYGPVTPARMLDVLNVLEHSGAPAAPAPVTGEEDLALPRRGEMALARAERLRASGHLHDALAELDTVRITDKERADADRLRADIERQLITRTP